MDGPLWYFITLYQKRLVSKYVMTYFWAATFFFFICQHHFYEKNITQKATSRSDHVQNIQNTTEYVVHWPVWQYGLWSFQTGYTKLERFLHKNQHTQRKLLNFESTCNVMGGGKKWQNLTFNVNFLRQKLSESFSFFVFE